MPVVLPPDTATQEAAIVSGRRRYRSPSIPSVDTAVVRPLGLPPPRPSNGQQENGKIEAETGPRRTAFSRKRPVVIADKERRPVSSDSVNRGGMVPRKIEWRQNFEDAEKAQVGCAVLNLG